MFHVKQFKGGDNMISRRGIVYDLTLSNYRCTLNGLTYVFSSQLHLDNFRKKYKENRSIINYSLSKRFNLKIDVPILADMVLYRKIETRGFLVINGEGKSVCQGKITFVGDVVTIQN